MKKLILTSILGIATLCAINSCSKTKKGNNQLDGGVWKVTELTVGSEKVVMMPTWDITDECKAYSAACSAKWELSKDFSAIFYWQIRNKGKIFEISNKSTFDELIASINNPSEEQKAKAEEVVAQSQFFSGIYDVKESSKKSFVFESKTIAGAEGKTVKITISKQ